jgi:hypothetical protein
LHSLAGDPEDLAYQSPAFRLGAHLDGKELLQGFAQRALLPEEEDRSARLV